MLLVNESLLFHSAWQPPALGTAINRDLFFSANVFSFQHAAAHLSPNVFANQPDRHLHAKALKTVRDIAATGAALSAMQLFWP